MVNYWYDIDMVKSCKNLDELFSLWKQAHKDECDYSKYEKRVNKNSFTRDGIICPREFGKQGDKFLLIAKEGHEFDEPDAEKNCADGVNFWVADGYCERIHGQKVSSFLNCLAAYCNAFAIDDYIFDCNKHLDRAILRNAAFMNINKRGGLKKCPNTVLKNYAERYDVFIQKEIDIIKPTVIICCGEGLSDLIKRTVNNPSNYKIIQAYHPSAHGGYVVKLDYMKKSVDEQSK